MRLYEQVAYFSHWLQVSASYTGGSCISCEDSGSLSCGQPLWDQLSPQLPADQQVLLMILNQSSLYF